MACALLYSRRTKSLCRERRPWIGISESKVARLLCHENLRWQVQSKQKERLTVPLQPRPIKAKAQSRARSRRALQGQSVSSKRDPCPHRMPAISGKGGEITFPVIRRHRMCLYRQGNRGGGPWTYDKPIQVISILRRDLSLRWSGHILNP